ncbi:MAG: single-stranded-DNA-specific exonuclease RecJ [Desulfitobacteriaceae bacterium]
MKQSWLLPKTTGLKALLFSETLAVSPVVADILVQRGLREVREAVDYLRPTMLSLASPFCFKDMSRVIDRLTRALKSGEKVLVHGDYDVDGVTSTALLYKTLIDLGFSAVTYIPHRQEEGYGLHRETIEKAAQAGVKVIITVDCGITAVEEIEFAKELGLEVIITDHHEPPKLLPAAYAIINPKVQDSGYPFLELAGVGVAFKVAQALLRGLKTPKVGLQAQKGLLDLVALGTVADVVPLIGENRILVYHGLKQMEGTSNLGLEALLTECGLHDKTLKAGTVAFTLAPRINAAGRMDSARPGLELLLTENPERAKELARKLSKENAFRQTTEKEILAEALEQLEKGELPRVIVLASAAWHHGVIGIVASRLVERYHRPVFMISIVGELAKGSARGIPGYHVLEQLGVQAERLERFGGHRQAAGFSLASEAIPGLKEGLNAEAHKLRDEVFQKVLTVDRLVDFSMLKESLQQELEQLAPFGFGNPGPVLAARQLPIYKISKVGKDGSHLKLHIGPKGVLEGMAFRQGERLSELLACPQLDLAFSLDINTFQGRQQLQLLIKDVQDKVVVHDGELAKELLPSSPSEEGSDRCAALETAAGLELDTSMATQIFEGLDWRKQERGNWFQKVLTRVENDPISPNVAQRTVIWDSSVAKLFSFRDFFQNNKSAGTKTKGRLLEDSCISSQVLGIIVGIPLTRDDFRLGIETVLSLGVQQIALAEFELTTEQVLQRRCGYLSREELIQDYRFFLNLAKHQNPFFWTPLKNEQNTLEALKIFEELGFVRYMGGATTFVLELLPSDQKLNLECSLRYASAKRYWESTNQFQNELKDSSWKSLMLSIESMRVK